jgi:hypothetical protein
MTLAMLLNGLLREIGVVKECVGLTVGGFPGLTGPSPNRVLHKPGHREGCYSP